MLVDEIHCDDLIQANVDAPLQSNTREFSVSVRIISKIPKGLIHILEMHKSAAAVVDHCKMKPL